ncbi:hypothetical protein [Sphingomonas bacterium]|uniref:hypothetical protein n=1 Tax=Sphingomonas bacterium TaxID=1895847 RepID=UPI0015772763|nr:hypothetical protein [Sphingomonas bacterium]
MQGDDDRPLGWWQTRWFVAAMALAAIVPLLWQTIPPLVDYPGHVGRYRILDEAGTPPLAAHWAVHWSLIGNLGVDLLVLALHPLLDVEPAARLIVTLIPPLTVLAMLWIAREAHGRLPASAGLALPLAFGFPFQLGFINFCLAQAMALAGLALWLRLARTRPAAWRIALFAPIAAVTWLAHSFGWAMLGLFVLAAEWQLARADGLGVWRAGRHAALFCLPMALPLAARLAGGQRAGDTGDWFNLLAKAQWVVSLLRDHWQWWDLAGVALIACTLWAAIRSPRLRFVPVLGVPALAGIAAFLCLPRLADGGAYVDMRMLPASVALALLAVEVRPDSDRLERRLALTASAFVAARTVATTLSFLLYAQDQAMVLRALPSLPQGSGTLVLVDQPGAPWSPSRLAHIAGIATARRRVFTNEQWAIPGQQPIRPLHPSAAPLDRDPSQLVYPEDASYRTTDLDAAIARFDRCTFSRVWTIGFPVGRVSAPDLRPIWADPRSAVYAVRAPLPDACRAAVHRDRPAT